MKMSALEKSTQAGQASTTNEEVRTDAVDGCSSQCSGCRNPEAGNTNTQFMVNPFGLLNVNLPK